MGKEKIEKHVYLIDSGIDIEGNPWYMPRYAALGRSEYNPMRTNPLDTLERAEAIIKNHAEHMLKKAEFRAGNPDRYYDMKGDKVLWVR